MQDAGAEVRAAQHGVSVTPVQTHDDQHGRQAHVPAAIQRSAASAVGAGGQPSQQPDGRRRQRHVEEGEAGEGRAQSGRCRDAGLGPEHVVDQPRLAPELGAEPSELVGQECERAAADHGEQRQAILGARPAFAPQPVPQAQGDEIGADADHAQEGQPHWQGHRRAVLLGEGGQPADRGVRVILGEDAQEVGDLEIEHGPRLAGDRDAAQAEPGPALGGVLPLERRQFGRLVVGDGPPQ
jgi:hypothetical protein